MDARVRREELLHATEHWLERARRRSSVELYIRSFMAVDTGHEHPVTDQRNRKHDHDPPLLTPTSLGLATRRRCPGAYRWMYLAWAGTTRGLYEVGTSRYPNAPIRAKGRASC